MSAKFITALLAAGALIATLATASPVHAGDKDQLKKFVGAAIGLYILGQALDGHQKGHKKKAHSKKAAKIPALPRYCVRQVGGKHQKWQALSAHCLKKNYSAAHKLPGACRTSAWYKGRDRAVYTIGCLNHRGFQLAWH
jgi:hypothetical protein